MHGLSSPTAKARKAVCANENKMKDRFNLEDDIEISERYDKEDDVYYVTLLTGEPSLVEEVDDRLLIEFGFTRMPTGFRILNYSKVKVEAEAFKISFKKACKTAGLRKRESADRHRQMERRIDRFFDTVGA
jgi:uncharacterized protein YuzE